VGYFICALVNGPDINHIFLLAGKTCSVSSDWLSRGDPKCQQTRQSNRASGEKQSRETSEIKKKAVNNAATRLWDRWGHPHSTGRGEWGHSGDEHKEQEQEVGRGKNIHTWRGLTFFGAFSHRGTIKRLFLYDSGGGRPGVVMVYKL
jgi:hypothetical protein